MIGAAICCAIGSMAGKMLAMLFDHSPLTPPSPFDARYLHQHVRRDGSAAFPELMRSVPDADYAATLRSAVDAALARPARSKITPPKKLPPPSLTQSRRDMAQRKTEMKISTQPRRINMTAEQIAEQEARAIANTRAYDRRRYLQRQARKMAANPNFRTRNRIPGQPKASPEKLAKERARYHRNKLEQTT
jgi:hypothetical protein